MEKQANNKNKRDFIIYMAICTLIALAAGVYDHIKKNELKGDWEYNGVVIRGEISAKDFVSNSCELIEKYCPIIDEKNDAPILIKNPTDSVTSIPASVLCKQCTEEKARQTNPEKFYGKRPRNNWFSKYPQIIRDYIESRVDDPDSIQDLECSYATPAKKYGWETVCNFRMKNKFGGYERFSSNFLMSDTYATCSEKCEIYKTK